MKAFCKWAAVAVACSSLIACGGGGSDSAPPQATATPEGMWVGTAVSRGSTLDLGMIVLKDGRYFGIYSLGGYAYGLLQGSGSVSGSAFTSTDGRDYPFSSGAYLPFTLSASFVPHQTVSGSAQYNGFTATFTSTYDTGYETPASLSDVAGTYSGSAGSLNGVSNVTLTVAADGAFSGVTSLGCKVSGALTPRSGGTAVLDMSLTFDLATCGIASTVTGVAGKTGTKKLSFAATLPDRSDAFFGIANKP